MCFCSFSSEIIIIISWDDELFNSSQVEKKCRMMMKKIYVLLISSHLFLTCRLEICTDRKRWLLIDARPLLFFLFLLEELEIILTSASVELSSWKNDFYSIVIFILFSFWLKLLEAMLLHDSFFIPIDQSINGTIIQSTIVSHSPVFYSIWTLTISIIGCLSNLFCLIKLISIRLYHRNSSSIEIPSNHWTHERNNSFLLILVVNTFGLAILSLISSFDERFFHQSLLARFHLCSVSTSLWKFILHLLPLLTIFILLHYHYQSYKQFSSDNRFRTTFDQFLSTELCIIIPCILALAWSIDGLWLWGQMNIDDIVRANQKNTSTTTTMASEQVDEKTFEKLKQLSICYLQINDDLRLTNLLLNLIHMDYILLLCLQFIGKKRIFLFRWIPKSNLYKGFLLEISLQIRLCRFCSMSNSVNNSSLIYDQQMAFYMVYVLFYMTITSLPFYFFRCSEILFDSQFSFYHHELINSSTFAEVLLSGMFVQPVLYAILFFPSKFLFCRRNCVNGT